MSYSMEKNNNLAAPSHIQLPPGFRFHPSDEELIVHYLTNKVASIPLPASIIDEIDLYKYNPWDLPRKALFGEEEWYFFTPRDRKYPNGARPNRAAASGFWKATGTDKPILTSFGTKSIGVKKALVFYEGRPPKGYKTDWIMHEYRLPDTIAWTPKRKGSMRLDDWVLCRVRQKSINSRKAWDDRNGNSYEAATGFISKVNELRHMNNTNPNVEMVKSYLYNDCPMLPYIFASRDFTSCCINTDSNISFQGGDKSWLAAHDEDSLFNPLKRIKLMEKNQQDDCVPPSKKIKEGYVHKEEEIILSVSNESTGETNISETDHSEGNNFSHDHHQWSRTMQYHQELNNLVFTGK